MMMMPDDVWMMMVVMMMMVDDVWMVMVVMMVRCCPLMTMMMEPMLEISLEEVTLVLHAWLMVMVAMDDSV